MEKHERKLGLGLLLFAVAGFVVISSTGACPQIDSTGLIGETKVDGTPYGADFRDSTSGHKVVSEGASDSTVIRIAPRPDLCEAVMDPTDEVDPSLIMIIRGIQPQVYQVVGLDYTGPSGGGAPPPTATVTLQTHTSACDAGVEDVGPGCAVNQAAASGQIDLVSLVDNEVATGTFTLEFPGGGGTVTGEFEAPYCTLIR